MDRILQRGTLTSKSLNLTPKERAEAARRYLIETAEHPRGVFHHIVRRHSISAVSVALLGGFVVGFWPWARRALTKNSISAVKMLYKLRLFI